MNKTEAQSIILNELNTYRASSYDELKALIDKPAKTEEIKLENGHFYQTEIMVYWDDSKERKDIRVIAAIDDGGLRVFSPMSEDFIMAPNGKFIDE